MNKPKSKSRARSPEKKAEQFDRILEVGKDMFVKIGSQFPNLLEKLHDNGHEIGYHAHGLIESTKERQEEIITNGLEKLRDMGYKPVSFRAGRYHFNTQILKILEKNSIKYDSSIIPNINVISIMNHNLLKLFLFLLPFIKLT